MNIPELSMALSQTKLQNDVGTAMLGKALELADTFGENLDAMLKAPALESSVTPHLGGSIDVLI